MTENACIFQNYGMHCTTETKGLVQPNLGYLSCTIHVMNNAYHDFKIYTHSQSVSLIIRFYKHIYLSTNKCFLRVQLL